MIFIGGIHGVGKTFFCKRIKDEMNISTYSASQLILKKKRQNFSADKFASNIEGNQSYLKKL